TRPTCRRRRRCWRNSRDNNQWRTQRAAAALSNSRCAAICGQACKLCMECLFSCNHASLAALPGAGGHAGLYALEPYNRHVSTMPQPSTMLDHPLVSSRYFFPRREVFPNPYWVDAVDGSKLACSYHAVNPDATTVVYFHGNGEVVADYLPGFPDWLTPAGYNVLLAEYRGYGMATGPPALGGMLEDAPAIVRSLGIRDSRIVLFGRSIGSLYAVHGVSRHPQLAGVILESGIANITERFFMRIQAFSKKLATHSGAIKMFICHY